MTRYLGPDPAYRVALGFVGDGLAVVGEANATIVAYAAETGPQLADIQLADGSPIPGSSIVMAGPTWGPILFPDVPDGSPPPTIWVSFDGGPRQQVPCDLVDYLTRNPPSTAPNPGSGEPGSNGHTVVAFTVEEPRAGMLTLPYPVERDSVIIGVSVAEAEPPVGGPLVLNLQTDPSGSNSAYADRYASGKPTLTAGQGFVKAGFPPSAAVTAGSLLRGTLESAPAAVATVTPVSVAAGTSGSASINTYNIPIPASAVAGDLLVHALTCPAATTVTPPTGWAVAADEPNASTGGQLRVVVLTKTGSGSESTTQAVGLSTGSPVSWATRRYRGSATSPPFDVVATTRTPPGGSSNVSAQSIAPVQSGGVVLLVFGARYGAEPIANRGMTVTPADGLTTKIVDEVTTRSGAGTGTNMGLTLVETAAAGGQPIPAYTAVFGPGDCPPWVASEALPTVGTPRSYAGNTFLTKVALTAAQNTAPPVQGANWSQPNLFEHAVALALSIAPASGGPGRGLALTVTML